MPAKIAVFEDRLKIDRQALLLVFKWNQHKEASLIGYQDLKNPLINYAIFKNEFPSTSSFRNQNLNIKWRLYELF